MAMSEADVPHAKRARCQTIFADGDLSKFTNEQIVPVVEPWRVLLDFIITHGNRRVLIRAPPRSGKSFLGQLAGQRGQVPGEWNVEVRYCPNVASGEQLDILLKRGNFQSVADMAVDSWRSGQDGRRTIVYFFDETHDIPPAIVDAFLSNGEHNGYAVFATAGKAAAQATLVTPRELADRTFFYRSPAPMQALQNWLQACLKKQFPQEIPCAEAQAAAELVINIANGVMGLVTFLAVQIERNSCRNLRDVRTALRSILDKAVDLYPRVFATKNGKPDDEQAKMLSMLRCSGSLRYRSATGESRYTWQVGNSSHRRGLSKALFAVQVVSSLPLEPVREDGEITFVHPLHPEIFEDKFKHDWADASYRERWVTNFAGRDAAPAAVPSSVIDLVLSWLSHVTTPELLYAYKAGRVDSAEDEFQRSFDIFAREKLGLSGEREQHAGNRRRLDHFVDQNMGVELLIRASQDNTLTTRGLLENKETRKSLVEHAERGNDKYLAIARQCTNGYITVLPATLTGTTADDEWQKFQQLGQDLSKVGHPVLVAVAPFGWAEWQVFLHRPGQDPLRLQAPRQRLMLKLDDQVVKVVSARQFYPKPEEVWAQRLTRDMQDGGGSCRRWRLTGKAFEVKPAKDNVAALARIIKDVESLKDLPLSQLAIYRQNVRTGEWDEEEEDSVLYENTKQRPYGFLIPG